MKARHHSEAEAASAAAATKEDVHRPTFQDWAQFVSFRPQLYFRPQDLGELKSFLTGIQQGALGPRNPRILGGLHSCSDICVSDAIVDVSDLPKQSSLMLIIRLSQRRPTGICTTFCWR